MSSEDSVGSVISVVFGGYISSGRGCGSISVGVFLSGGGGSFFGGFMFNFFGVMVEEEVREDVLVRRIGRVMGNGVLEMEDFLIEEVLYEIDRVMRFVVGGDGNVDEFGGSVSVIECDDIMKLLVNWMGK